MDPIRITRNQNHCLLKYTANRKQRKGPANENNLPINLPCNKELFFISKIQCQLKTQGYYEIKAKNLFELLETDAFQLHNIQPIEN